MATQLIGGSPAPDSMLCWFPSTHEHLIAYLFNPFSKATLPGFLFLVILFSVTKDEFFFGKQGVTG